MHCGSCRLGPARLKKSACSCCLLSPGIAPPSGGRSAKQGPGPATTRKAALGEQNRCAASVELLGPHRPVVSGRGSGPIVDLRRLGVPSLRFAVTNSVDQRVFIRVGFVCAWCDP
eukprot:SAG25_NODE_931_length_4680_cov_189.657935_2_plen_115_part_00